MTTTRKVRRMARDPQSQGEGAQDNGIADSGSVCDSTNPPEPKAARVTKQSLLIDMLGREGGVSLNVIVEATGWQPHTTRAALTGLRKKGLTIERFRGDDETRYRIVTASAEALVDETHSGGDADDASAGAGLEADADGGATA